MTKYKIHIRDKFDSEETIGYIYVWAISFGTAEHIANATLYNTALIVHCVEDTKEVES